MSLAFSLSIFLKGRGFVVTITSTLGLKIRISFFGIFPAKCLLVVVSIRAAGGRLTFLAGSVV